MFWLVDWWLGFYKLVFYVTLLVLGVCWSRVFVVRLLFCFVSSCSVCGFGILGFDRLATLCLWLLYLVFGLFAE